MSTSHNSAKRGVLTVVLLVSMVMWAMPAAYADGGGGHIGSKPPNADGDGIPTNSDPDFAYGSRNGEQNASGDPFQGSDPACDGGDGIPNGGPIEGGDPASDGGDGIPNGGPIEGDGHSGKGNFGPTLVSWLFSLMYSI